MIPLILLAYLGFLVLAWKNLFLAVQLTLFLLPTYLIRFDLGPLPFNFLSGLIWIVFLSWLIKNLKDKKIFFSLKNLTAPTSLWPATLKWPTILFILSAVISLFVAQISSASLGLFKAYIIETFLFIIVLLTCLKTKNDWFRILSALASLVGLMGVLALIQRFTGWFIPAPYLPPNSFRTTLFFSYPNAGPLFIAPLIPIFIAASLYLKTINFKKALLFFVSSLFGLMAILLAKSDGALIGLIIGLIIFFLAYNKKTRILALVIIALSLVTFFSLPVKKQKPIIRTLEFQTWSGQTRLYQWRETSNLIKDRWLTGSGFGNYQTAFAPYHKVKGIDLFMYPHNIILNFWTELGLFGLLSVLWLIFAFFKQIFSLIRNNQDKIIAFGLMAGFLTLLIHGLVDVPFFKNDLAILWWLIILTPFIYPRLDLNR